MKKFIITLSVLLFLAGCSANKHCVRPSNNEKLHNKGVAIEKFAPRHIDDVTREVAGRASSATLKH